MAKPAEQTYALPIVMEAIGISEDTATNWARRNMISIRPSGRGRARMINESTVLKMALMKVCADAGMGTLLSNHFANKSLAMLQSKKDFTKLHRFVSLKGDGFYADDNRSPRDDTVLCISLNVRQIVESVRGKLDECAGTRRAPG